MMPKRSFNREYKLEVLELARTSAKAPPVPQFSPSEKMLRV